ncbi:amidohydrolase family protein [Candidatus Roizmanbacteria bacterium]|nr:amidohydrolase family protein [Candidatus Roizmanbacteria bacterium]
MEPEKIPPVTHHISNDHAKSKKKILSLLFIIVPIIVLGGLLAYFLTNKSPQKDVLTTTMQPSGMTESSKSEPVFTEFQPELTYEGAYNGPLYDTSSKIGDSAPLDLHFENMDRNGVNYVIGYFFAEEVSTSDYVKGALKKHPGRIIPFYSSGLGGKEAEAYVGDKLTNMFEMSLPMAKKHVGENTIKGIGEIEIFQWNMPHNDPKILQLFDFAQKNNLHVMMHPIPGKITHVTDILEKYPETTFLIHMFQDDFAQERTNIIKLMKDHTNIYYTIDIDHLLFDRSAGTGLLYKYEGKDIAVGRTGFIQDFDSKYEAMLIADLALYKPLIEAHPDRVTWGTEMNIRYTYEPEVYDRMIKFMRLFIGSLDPSIQENIGYKNALRIFGPGVVLEE